MPRTLVLVADGTEEMEAVITIAVLRRAGWPVTVAAAEDCQTITASRGMRLVADRSLSECEWSDYELVVLPGGKGGADRFCTSETVQQLLKRFDAEGKAIAAICAAPLALNAAGILRQRHYTCYPGVEAAITSGQHQNRAVVHDENLITSQGPGTTFAFALALVESFESKKAADVLRRQMLLS